MTEKVEKKKKSLPSPNGEGIKEARPTPKEVPENVMSVQKAGEQFLEKLAKQPGKIEGMIEKLNQIDLDDVLDKLASPPGSVSNDPIVRVIQEDILLLGQALAEIDDKVDKHKKAIEFLIADMEKLREGG